MAPLPFPPATGQRGTLGAVAAGCLAGSPSSPPYQWHSECLEDTSSISALSPHLADRLSWNTARKHSSPGSNDIYMFLEIPRVEWNSPFWLHLSLRHRTGDRRYKEKNLQMKILNLFRATPSPSSSASVCMSYGVQGIPRPFFKVFFILNTQARFAFLTRCGRQQLRVRFPKQ